MSSPIGETVTARDVEEFIDAEFYFTALDGVIGARDTSSSNCMTPAGAKDSCMRQLGLMTFCTLVLKNGYVVVGQSACADPLKFDAEIGRQWAKVDAQKKIWPLLGFQLRTKLWEREQERERDASYIGGPEKQRSEFGYETAITLLKMGQKVCRKGWNGKGMYLYLVPENRYPPTTEAGREIAKQHEDGLVPYGAYVAMKTAQENIVPWLCSQSDLVAEDWESL